MTNVAIKVENLSKIYRLGEIGTGSIGQDLDRWFKIKVLGQEDPFLKIGQSNDRTIKGDSDIVYSLRDLNFEIKQGDAVGIIGRNGAGKSTLLKILSRVTTPTSGRINIKGRVASLLEVGTGFHPELTGRENIYLNGAILGMRKREIDYKLDEIIDFSGVERYIDTPVKRYSSGMYVRLAFAVAAHLESEILIVDEVLAVGDVEFQKKCLGKMGEVSKGDGRTVLFVSHNMLAVEKLCDYGLLLGDGEIIKQSTIKNILSSYVEAAPKNTFIKNDGFVRRVTINQRKERIVINVEFKAEFEINGVGLGFVISELDGTKICGGNSFSNDLIKHDIKSLKSGVIECVIDSLFLFDGCYVLSLWFGDRDHDLEELIDFLQFDVIDMVINTNRGKNKISSGPINAQGVFTII
jgi:lipopolysaccharide transport system ATP-binding protein